MIILRFSRVRTFQFLNLRGLPKNKNASPGPLSGEQHQNRSTTRTGLRATPHDILGVGQKEAAPITVLLQREEKR